MASQSRTESQASSTEPNYTAQCVAAQQAKAQAVILLYAPETAVTIAGNCATQNYFPIYDMEGGAIDFATAIKAPGLEKHLIGPFTDLPTVSTAGGMPKINAAINKAHPGLEKSAAWTELSTSLWPAARLLQAAAVVGGLKRSGKASAALIRKGLHSMKGDTLGGTAPPLTFAQGQRHTIDCWFTAEVLNGKAQMTNGGKVSCHS